MPSIQDEKKKSIALVTPAFDKGGLEQVVLNLYNGYRASGHDCIVLIESNVSGYMTNLIRETDAVIVFDGDENIFLNALLKHDISVVHYHYSIFGLPTIKTLGLHTIYTLHNIYSWLNDDQFHDRARTISNADHVVAVSQFVRDYFVRRTGKFLKNICIIPNGIDVERLSSTATPLTKLELDLPEHCYIFAHLASAHRNKHHAILVGAAEVLLNSREDFYIALIGNEGDFFYRKEIQELINNSPAKDNIGFRSFVPAGKISSLYRDIVDCVVLPSIQEGCSNVLLECIATERRIIATNVGFATEAAAMSSVVRLVSPPFEDIMTLTPSIVEDISKNSQTSNMQELAVQMRLSMEDPSYSFIDDRPLRTFAKLMNVQEMAKRYLELIK